MNRGRVDTRLCKFPVAVDCRNLNRQISLQHSLSHYKYPDARSTGALFLSSGIGIRIRIVWEKKNMGVLEHLAGPLGSVAHDATGTFVAASVVACFVLVVVLNVLRQLLFKNRNEPPVVFHWFPVLGNTITYGMEPYKFFFDCQKKYGDVFTFVLLGKKTTVYTGTAGNEFILNGRLKDVCAEEIYTPLTTPVFGKGVVYDCPNSKLMEQKKFMKFGLTTDAFRAYVPLIVDEINNFLKGSPDFKGQSGKVDVPGAMAEITIYTASRSLQGKEVREKFDSSFAGLYHDLDMGFSPINFMLSWAPLPHNNARDRAQRKIANLYMDIIKERRAGNKRQDGERDMIWHLMDSTYKNGTPVPDKEIAHMMIALLMAGQHSSASASSWAMIRLASRPDIVEELYQEQKRALGDDLPPLKYEDLAKLPLHQAIIKETLRLHTPIHSIMRAVKSPMPVPGTPYTIPTSHVLLATPGMTSRVEEYFPNPTEWDPHRWDPDSKGLNLGEVKEEHEDYGYGMVSKGAKSPYLPFGAGRHRCIGEQFANVQLGVIIATLVRQFKIKLPAGTGVAGTDFTSLFSKPITPAIIEWERREKA
ncbi:MAG: Lanosterol 14-alpha-demethylase [Claussenomyces sp. TS43310]|nr:MAG: Lanosterol 14-alpha-demethylase [Claussenomyces sp. TS43310]